MRIIGLGIFRSDSRPERLIFIISELLKIRAFSKTLSSFSILSRRPMAFSKSSFLAALSALFLSSLTNEFFFPFNTFLIALIFAKYIFSFSFVALDFKQQKPAHFPI